MENSGGDQLRIWLRNNDRRLSWRQALELLESVLDETKNDNQGADCIDAWMNWAVRRYTQEQIHAGLFAAREYGLGDVYTVAWNDTETGLDEMDADLEVKINMAKREMATMDSGDGVGGEGGEGEAENGHRDEQGDTCSETCGDTGIESASEETREEGQLFE
ncbi:hypothetical protein PG993_006357 [Apiospora rasikravindrae]|uniref:Uncharacterized protein n=1 Tax=Apiospora rasikravindrae TaxID=990691 RepID=A0ABR1T5F2_9PEZI